MNPAPDEKTERIEELLADRALQGISAVEAHELTALGGEDDQSWDLTVAAVERSLLDNSPQLEPLPADLHARILENYREKDARTLAAGLELEPPPATVPFQRGFTTALAWTGWLTAAAAMVALAVIATRPPDKQPEPRIIAQSSEEELIRRLEQVSSKAALKATDHPLANGSSGELIWNAEQQKGFMKIKGLAPVDPKKGTYQLWIFDRNRDKRYPVDGGTFNIAENQTTNLVPIVAKLKVDRPSLFAITLEPPGGVVVSDRQRIMLTATWGEG